MGRRSRAERRAKRKAKRAKKKLERAQKKQDNGNTRAAKRLRKRAEKLKKRAEKINTAVKGQVIRGLSAKVTKVNSLDNVIIKAEWNYLSHELSRYNRLEISMAPANPVRGTGRNQKKTFDVSKTSHTFSLTKNLRYVVKLFGVQGGHKKLLDRTFVKKYK